MRAVALAMAYYMTGKLGLMLPSVGETVTLFWPPSGLAVFALAFWGRHYWPGIFAGAVLVNLGSHSPAIAVAIAVGNTIGPIISTFLLRWLQFDRSFISKHSVFHFVVGGAALGMIVPSLNGTLWLWFSGSIGTDRVVETAVTWWMGDVCGVLLIAPPLFLLPSQFPIWKQSRRFAVGQAIGISFAIAVAAGVFWGGFPLGEMRLPLGFLPTFAVFWVVMRFRIWAGSVAVLGVVTVALICTAAGSGPYANYDGSTRLFLIWTFAASSGFLMTVAAATIGEGDRAVLTLKTREEEYRTVLAESPALILRFRPDGTITFSNDWAMRFFGRAPGDPYTSIHRHTPEADRRRLADVLDETARTGLQVPVEIGHVTPHGTRVVRWVARAVLNSNGNVAEFHAIGVDVTEQRRAEDDRRKLDEQMVQVQKWESLGVLAAGLAHDVTNVLTAVGGFADLARATLPTRHPAVPHLARVRESTTRAADLARQLLAYAGQGKIVVGPVDVNALVRDGIRLLETSLPKRVALALDLTDETVAVPADAAQLRQVIVNLVMNAGEAYGDASGVVTIRTSVDRVNGGAFGDSVADRELAPGEYALLEVRDTGCGMDDETRSRVFDPFFTTKFTGRGLGLAAVLGIVRGHKGTVRVRSKPGIGTIITVLLPTTTTPVTVPDRASERPTVDTESEIDLRKETVIEPSDVERASKPFALVVDDEEAVRYVTSAMLERLGWQVIAVSGGREAVDRYRVEFDRIGIVVLDLTMPDMDGHETLAELRRIRANVPVIICSGYAKDAVEGQGDALPFLPKPFALEDLKVALAAAS